MTTETFLKKIQRLQFKNTENGEKIFHPFGIIGKGIVLDEQGHLLLQKGTPWDHFINALFFALLLVSLLHPSWLNVIVIGFILSHMTKNFLIVRHYPRTINRLTLAESAKECAEIFSVGTVITLLFVTGAILLGSIYVIVTDAVGDGAGISHFIGNTFSLIIFCTATYIASLMLIEKIKAIKHTK